LKLWTIYDEFSGTKTVRHKNVFKNKDMLTDLFIQNWKDDIIDKSQNTYFSFSDIINIKIDKIKVV
jgi:hypothetical protein